MRRAVLSSRVFPVLVGSAVTGAGVDLLSDVLTPLVYSPVSNDGELSGIVFAIDHDERGRRAWIRLWSGSLAVRSEPHVAGIKPSKVTEVCVPTPNGLELRKHVNAGQIAAVRGLDGLRIGTHIGVPSRRVDAKISPPALQAFVHPVDPTQRGRMYSGLLQMAEEDPLIDLRLDERAGQAAVRVHGEVQKEVLESLLLERFDVAVRFEETSVVCIERVVGNGEAVERVGENGNPYLAAIGIRITSRPDLEEVVFVPGTERGRLPTAFITACEEGVRAALLQGLHGWQVIGCEVELTETEYFPRQSRAHQKFNKSMSSVAADFRHLAPVVIMQSLTKAGTQVCEPIERIEVEIPQDLASNALSLITGLAGQINETLDYGAFSVITATLPSSRLPALASALPNASRGEGILTSRLSHYAPVAGQVLSQPRVGPDPRLRENWFRAMSR